jgi:UDP-glucose 6-dehydrogenase
MASKLRIGFVGQGYVGKNYADNFEARGFKAVRYSLEEQYVGNKADIRDCDIVFIAVPTPTTPEGFDDRAVRDAVGLVGDGKIAVIKSTIVPGTTKAIQKKFPRKTVLFSPEFLSAATAAKDAANPFSSIVGYPRKDAARIRAARHVLTLLPKAPFSLVCDSTEAEVIKYAHNINGYLQIVFANMLYDLTLKQGGEWEPIRKAIESDPFMSGYYYRPVHGNGRGAGGGCFIKDFAAFRETYGKLVPKDAKGFAALTAFERKNIDLLVGSGKNPDLLVGVYGKRILKRKS